MTLRLDPRNARKHSETNKKRIRQSLETVGPARSIFSDADDIIRGGNGVYEQAQALGIPTRIVESDGKELIVVKRVDLKGKDAIRAAALDNIAADSSAYDYDAVILAEIARDDVVIAAMAREDARLAELLKGEATGVSKGQARQTLAERFIIPPFSVLDARQGYWQERKRAWIALGIESELGRGTDIVPNGSHRDASQDGCYKRGFNATPGGSPRPAASLVDGHTVRGDGKGRAIAHGALAVSDTILREKPSADQGVKRGLSRSNGQDLMKGENENFPTRLTWVAGDRPEVELDECSRKNLAATQQTGTSIFDPVLCEIAYRWFCPQGGTVLDPFAGGSVRGIVAAYLNYGYIGIDLRPEQIAANEEQAQGIVPGNMPRWITGDSRNLAQMVSDKADLIFSCPPYFDLELYSENPQDLSNAGEYGKFIADYRAIVAQAVGLLNDNRFACFVVGDIRDKKGFYRNFVSDTIAAFQDAGATLYNEAILVTAVGSLPIRVGAQFGHYRKLGKTHQNVLVFFKGDPKTIKENYGAVEIGTDG